MPERAILVGVYRGRVGFSIEKGVARLLEFSWVLSILKIREHDLSGTSPRNIHGVKRKRE